ncbi:pentapeptide repeat-containing protein [Ktedonobacter racemifer]|nr:pentapeptide repeat-containing protein [Ktedonobacter racemifer]
MKRSFRMSQVVSHPSTLAVFSGLFAAVIAFLINLISGGNTSSQIIIALVFAILFSLGLASWQMYTQDQSGKQWMAMMQELVFQTYFLTLLTDNPEISQIAQQRLGQVLKTLNGDQQLSMLKFFVHNGLPATLIGDALQGSKALVGADLQKIVLPQINLAQMDLRRVNFREANLQGADLSGVNLYRADLSGANLSHATLKGADLRGADLRGTDLTGADLSDSSFGEAKGGHDALGSQGERGSARHPDLQAHLSHAQLAGAKMRGSYLSGVDLSQANLRGADLSKAYFYGANLQGADLSGANLTETTLTEANIEGANLTEANLSKATLIGANLRQADLSGARLTLAIFEMADLREAKVTDEQLCTIGSGEALKREP